MSIDGEVLNSRTVASLCDMYVGEYMQPSSASRRDPLPLTLNALGACAGFAAQVAVWRGMVLSANRNPGDFLVYAAPKSNGILFFGEAINQFLFATTRDRLSFLSLAAGPLSNPSELPDIGELTTHVARSVGTDEFGRPRLPPAVELPELPRAALTRTWGKAIQILQGHPAVEWPALLGATAYDIVDANRTFLAPPVAVRILLEAAVPMSKLDPSTVEQSDVPAPSLTNWSMRALLPENTQAIMAEVRDAMPVMPARLSARVRAIREPRIAFLNLVGTRCEAIAAEDQAEIGTLFHGNVVAATSPVPICEVLFLYCGVERSGRIAGQGSLLRDLIAQSGASVAVVVSDVQSELFSDREFSKSLSRGANPAVNLVIVINRNGQAFAHFFKSLFADMWAGIPMPTAWVKLAPPGPQQPPDIPGSICLMEAGQVVFGTGRAW
jgi:hypothetical protein